MALVGTINASNDFGFKNRFINGSMLVAQYGTGANISSSNSFYTLDRWQSRNPASTGGTATYAQSFDSTSGVTKLRLTYASATSSAYFQQKIEAQNITDLWGSQVTFSLYSNDALVNVSAYSYDSSGTEATLFSNAVLTSLGGNRYSYTFTCTTPAGGIRGGNALGMIIQINVKGGATPSNSTNYDYWNCQLEKGSTATAFDYRDYGRELALCQRYYYKNLASSGATYFAPGFCYSATNAVFNYQFPVPMRTQPTALETTGTVGNYRVYSTSASSFNATAINFNNAETISSSFTVTVASGLTNGAGAFFIANISSAYLAWSAEL